MNREQVFEALMQADRADVAPLAARLKQLVPFTVVKKPQRELIMFQAEETVEKLDFNVGEILTTSAEVRVENTIGYSAVMSLDEELALDCALLMGVYEAGLPERKQVEALAIACAEKTAEQRRVEREIIDSTLVNFELMGGQDPNVSHNSPKDKQ